MGEGVEGVFNWARTYCVLNDGITDMTCKMNGVCMGVLDTNGWYAGL